MRILALETTEMTGTVAAACDDNLLAEKELSRRQRSAQSLAPAIRSLLGQVGWETNDVELVAVVAGPGSFTGLRIGVTMAKTLAYAVGSKILGIDTLETIAAAAPPAVTALSAAVDAQRGQVVAQAFQRDEDGWFRALKRSRLLDVDAWLQGVPPETFLSGPVLRKLADRVPKGACVLDESCWRPRAALVARLAARDYAAGRRDDLWSLVPRYSRRSAAEEKWEAKHRRRE